MSPRKSSPRSRDDAPDAQGAPGAHGAHGAHTLRVWEGTVVGENGDDVFVELGARMQGVISRRQFGAAPPRIGATYEFTLRGQEESLWVLARSEEGSLPAWEEMEEGLIVQARVVREKPGGLELLVGRLHAFLPRSQTGLPREKPPGSLVGKRLACEVIQIDRERQRVVLSRKSVLKRERESWSQRQVNALRPGQVVQGRVTRLEPYGAFVRFGRGLEGLIHVSDLSYGRVGHPRELLRRGDRLDVKVLHVKERGKRIGLGLKQMEVSPWIAFEREHAVGAIVAGEIKRVVDYGAFVAVAPGVEGLLHRSQTPYGNAEPLRRHLRPGDQLAVRILELKGELGRLGLSLLHPSGRTIDEDDAAGARALEEARDELREEPPSRSLGDLLRAAQRRARGEGGTAGGS